MEWSVHGESPSLSTEADGVGAGFSLIGPRGGSWERNGTADPLDDLYHLANDKSANKASILVMWADYPLMSTGDVSLSTRNKAQHQAVTQSLYKSYLSSSFGRWALPSRISDIDAGYLSRSGIWDKILWKNVRSSVLSGLLGDSLRSIIVLDGTLS